MTIEELKIEIGKIQKEGHLKADELRIILQTIVSLIEDLQNYQTHHK